MRYLCSALFVGAFIAGIGQAYAQPLGPYRWQMQPHCNVLTLSVTQNGGVYNLDGVDDMCAGPSPASIVGIAFLKPNGTIGMGLTIVVEAGAAPVHVSASISLGNLTGTWQDSSGNSGSFVFNGAALGSPRPLGPTVFISGLSAGGASITNVGPPVNATDATSREYVDNAISDAAPGWINVRYDATLRATSASLAGATVERPSGYPTGVYCIRFPAASGFQSEAAVGSIQQSTGGAGTVAFITVTTFYGNLCNVVGVWDVAVQTYSLAGAPLDRSFTVLIPRR